MSDNARPAKVVHLQRSRVGERPAGGPFCRHTGAQYEFEKAVNGKPTQQSAAVPGTQQPVARARPAAGQECMGVHNST